MSVNPDSFGFSQNWKLESQKHQIAVDINNQSTYSKGKLNGFSPSISLLSKQLSPYIFESSLSPGAINFGLTKDATDEQPLGYQANIGFTTQDSMTVSSTLNYKVSDKISASAGVQFATDSTDVKTNFGVHYRISQQKLAAITFVCGFSEWGRKLTDSMVIGTFVYKGYVIKVPLLTSEQYDWSSNLMSAALLSACHLVSYWALKRQEKKKPLFEKNEYVLAFATYSDKLQKMRQWVQDQTFYLQKSLQTETKLKGLVIIEAYFGLDEHVMLVEAGIMQFKLPQNTKEYYECQLIPVKKVLQLMVEDSQLVISREHFKGSK